MDHQLAISKTSQISKKSAKLRKDIDDLDQERSFWEGNIEYWRRRLEHIIRGLPEVISGMNGEKLQVD